MLSSECYRERLCAFVVDEKFCSTLQRMGEVRSLLPGHVKILALTATATVSVISSVMGMDNPCEIALSPCKENLMYTVNVSGT